MALAMGWEGPCWRPLLMGGISCQQGHGQLLHVQLSARGWELLLAPHPSCSTCSVEPLLRSGTKDRKYRSCWSKAPATLGTECRRNSQRIPEGLMQASCFHYRVIQEWIFNVCEQQMVLNPSAVKPLLAGVGCVLPCSWL